jgi:hypothetical protein
MRPRPLAAGLALVVALAAPPALACGGDDGGTDEGDGGDATAEAADAVCSLLRRWNDDLGAIVDATSQAITDDDDPATANDVLLDGYDELIAAAEGHVAEAEELRLPDVAGGEDLAAELLAGAEESVAVLEDERAAAAELGPIGVPQQAGALGQAFTGVERAVSVLQPQAGAYDEGLQAAFRADEGCRHVIQPTG